MWFEKLKNWLGLSGEFVADKPATSSEAAPPPVASKATKVPRVRGKSKSKARRKPSKKKS